MVTRVILVWCALLVTSGRALATDFATCPSILPACSATVTDCCYQTFGASGSDRPLIIPMDRCHQTPGTAKEGAPGSASPIWCSTSPSADDGMYHVYGLIHRMLQNGIPVYWIINPNKSAPALTLSQSAASQTYTVKDIDFWVLSPSTAPINAGGALAACTGTCVDPVKKINTTTMTATADSYNFKQFPVRGGAFVIAAEDRTRFNNLIKRTGEFSSFSSNSLYNFTAIDMYELNSTATFAYQNYSGGVSPYPTINAGSLPVTMKMNYEPQRLARFSPAGVSSVWLAKAKLNDPAASPACKTGTFSPSTAVYCDITESDIRSGVLVDGGFQWAWIDNWSDNTPCGNAAETTGVEKVREFLTAVPGVRNGGHVLFMESVINVFESCPNKQLLGRTGATAGLVGQNTDATEERLILRYPSNVFVQWGDVPTDFASGAITKWKFTGTGVGGYNTDLTDPTTGTLVRLVTEDISSAPNTYCINKTSTATCDVFGGATGETTDVASYARYNNDPENGVVFYMGGNNINSVSSQMRMLMNSFVALPTATVDVEDALTVTEVTRTSPIVSKASGTTALYQGVYEVESPTPEVVQFTTGTESIFEFPYFQGHLRAYDTEDILAGETDFEDITPIFDSASLLPPATLAGCTTNFAGTCRTIFTTTATPDSDGLVEAPARVFMDTDNAAVLQPFFGSTFTTAQAVTLISRVLAGDQLSDGSYVPKLGGIDRSTVAVIESSPLATVRPAMVYVGASDGMLHAFCASTLAPCTTKGQELWAYMPRTQLGFVATNNTRIDGSPKVADVYDDFDGNGVREWKTVLTLQSGWGNAGVENQQPTVTALDITNPADPKILWERTTPSTRDTSEMGIGLNTSMGPVQSGSTFKNATFVQTRNGGTGGAGFYLAAYNTATGARFWETSHTYPDPRNSSNPPVPATGIPGGAAAIDLDKIGSISHVVVGDLYGQMWEFKAKDGSNPYGSSPIFKFSSDHHPIGAVPTIYVDPSDGDYSAIALSGGYADPTGTSWAPSTVNQYAVGVKLSPDASLVPIAESGTGYGNARKFVIDLGAGNRAYSQAVVDGGELFITTDTDDVNGDAYGTNGTVGSLGRYSLDDGAQTGTIVLVSGGSSSVDEEQSYVYVGSGGGIQKIDFTGSDYNEDGTAVQSEDSFTSATRVLWISN